MVKLITLLLILIVSFQVMADTQRIIKLLKEISAPKNNQEGTLSDKVTTYKWIGPLRTPPRRCLSGEHSVVLFILALRRRGLAREVRLTFGSLDIHNVLIHGKEPDLAIREFFH